MKKKKFKIIMLLVVMMSASSAFSQVVKETHRFAIKGKDTLYVDRIYDPAVAAPENRPTMIYMYGGGWAFGDRGGDFRYLTDIGVQVVSIDYRKALTRYGYSNVIGTMPDTMSYAIDVALQDLTDAIAFVLSHSKEWAVDTQKVMLSGSSAGAVTTLHAIYDICNQGKYSKKFPDDFMPAGYIAYAGAMISEATDLKWNKKPCPMMFFHGSGDMVVPMSKRNVNKLTIFGPEYILNQLHQMEVPNWLYIEEGADHVISYKPFTGYNTAEIQTFITKFVIQGLKLEMYTKEKNMVAPSKLPGF